MSSEHEAVVARDEGNWARAVARLRVSNVPDGATNLNVDGRRLSGPIQGFGKLWQKTYRVRLPRGKVAPTDLIATWKQHFTEFWPDTNHLYAPLSGIRPGEIALINCKLSAGMKLSTGVLVLYADDESFTFMTPQGHPFAGWITFSATEHDADTVAQVQVLMRASDPIFELALGLGVHEQENRIWVRTLKRLAARFGEPAVAVETEVVCVDNKRQWANWRNVWQSSAIRSTFYMLGTPIRRLTSRRVRSGGRTL